MIPISRNSLSFNDLSSLRVSLTSFLNFRCFQNEDSDSIISSIAFVCYILNKKAADSLNNVFTAIENANNTSFKGKIVMTWTPSQSSLDHKSPGTVVVGNVPEGYIIEKFCINIVSPSIVNTGV